MGVVGCVVALWLAALAEIDRQTYRLPTALLWPGCVAVGLSAQAVRQRLLAWRQTIDRAFGGALMGLGVWLATARAGT